MLKDSFGRTLDYLRVSVTDRCNLRCVYCMPPEGVEWKPHETVLSFEDFLRICRIMTELGIRKIKVTGGEPLVRRGVASFIKNLKKFPGIDKVTLTTNGLLLGAYLDEAEAMGALPDGINISLDALNPERSKQISRNGNTVLQEISPLLDRMLKKNITVKINCVPIRNNNEEEILPITALAKDKNIAVRFIELMPLGFAAALEPVPGGEIAALLEKSYGALTPYSGVSGNGPAVYYKLPGLAGTIGFINAISRGFCETCSRLRLTSVGFLKLCLSDDLGMDLKELLRAGVSDNELAQAITEISIKKPRYHNLSEVYCVRPSEHPDGMSEIGG
ncbi:MAG: GTP 3',8-cyclase MoaA [Treponema sp.]|nr:GTP 3',8-cyclase MoaA [Treponema sp.]